MKKWVERKPLVRRVGGTAVPPGDTSGMHHSTTTVLRGTVEDYSFNLISVAQLFQFSEIVLL